MFKTTLVLNHTYEGMDFRSVERALHLIVKDKVEVVEEWDDTFTTTNREWKMPAVVRFLYRCQHRPRRLHYHRKSILYRDQYTCQYCGKQYSKNNLTVDHVIPRAKGGEDNWFNCVTACKSCNGWKGTATPEQAGMKLLRQPIVPNLSIKDDATIQPCIHPSWKEYLGT